MEDLECTTPSSCSSGPSDPLLVYQTRRKSLKGTTPLLRKIRDLPKKVGRAVKAKADMFNLTSHLRTKWMASLGESFRDYILYDPDMPEFMNRTFKRSFDKFWNDCEQELERTVEACFIEYENDANKQGPTGEGLYGVYCDVRALILHHFFPYNRTMFGKYQDPIYLLMFMLTLLPVHGLRCLLYLLLFRFQTCPGPSDEYQMVNFILNFKGLQFFSSGFIALIRGAWAYYSCFAYHKDDVLKCINVHGPGGNETFGQVFDYFGNIGLVWLAYRELPKSITVPLHANTEVKRADFMMRSKAAGERLKSLMCYDLVAFILSLTMFLYLSFSTGGFSSLIQTQENIFWCSVFYSLSALPFSFFYLPIIQYLLIHRDATGFNEYGACVTFALPAPAGVEVPEDSPERDLVEEATTTTTVLENMNRLLRWADIGRQKRGGDVGDYTFSDITKGARTRLKEKVFGEKEHNLLGLGKQFRVGDANAEYSFGDISRGIGWKIKTIGLGKDKEGDEFRDNRPLYIVPGSLKIPEVAPLPNMKNKHVYTVIVTLEDRAEMAEGQWKDHKEGNIEWEVLRRYSEFRNLMARLGPRCLSYQDTPFPRRHTFHMTSEKVEARRYGLERWLTAVVEDEKASEAPWAGYLRAFLDPRWEDIACSTFTSLASSGSIFTAASGSSLFTTTEESDSGGESVHIPMLPRLSEETEVVEHEMTAKREEVEALSSAKLHEVASAHPTTRRRAVAQQSIPAEFFQIASFIDSDASEDEVERDMFGSGSPVESEEGQLIETGQASLSEVYQRHDFGPTFHPTRCSACHGLTRNQGCLEQELIFCRACFQKHVPECPVCQTSHRMAAEANERNITAEDYAGKPFHISRSIFYSDDED